MTTGDEDGIGLEVATKALHAIGPVKNVQFILWRSAKAPQKQLKILNHKFKLITVNTLKEIDLLPQNSKTLIEIASTLSPVSWVEETITLCLEKKLNAMVTGPLSKTTMKEQGWADLGHTELLERLSQYKPLFMAFIGKKFNVVLATGHIPFAKVSETLSASLVENAFFSTLRLKELLEPILRSKNSKPIGVLGLNPHAGENGILGSEECSLLIPLIKKLQNKGYPIEGPLVPDAAFIPEIRKKYSFFLCLYHDQGLVPFKMSHGFNEGVHLTLGLPFLRTSVDHGTAKELFGKNKAKFGSMKEAILLTVKLLNSQ
ncbi:MAG: 4-hydroxythreonine-4-phosphate dehydrogenase PdxA [Bdellovibrionales bacterium]|nr:4-hydroxythreonine-4-phosphate dehydrogenase PdxA [Bdellovibrionales bacterium]